MDQKIARHESILHVRNCIACFEGYLNVAKVTSRPYATTYPVHGVSLRTPYAVHITTQCAEHTASESNSISYHVCFVLDSRMRRGKEWIVYLSHKMRIYFIVMWCGHIDSPNCPEFVLLTWDYYSGRSFQFGLVVFPGTFTQPKWK